MRKPVHNMKGCTLIIQRMKPLVRLVSSADIDLLEHMMAAGGKPHLPIETSLTCVSLLHNGIHMVSKAGAFSHFRQNGELQLLPMHPLLAVSTRASSPYICSYSNCSAQTARVGTCSTSDYGVSAVLALRADCTLTRSPR